VTGAGTGVRDQPGDTVLLALGNILVGDDGAGPAALAELVRGHRLPQSLRVLDGGVLGLTLLGLVRGADALLVLDAVDVGRPAGELVRLESDQLRAVFAARLSSHELGFAELLAGARLLDDGPRRLVIWGVQPGDVSPRIGLSPAVARAIGPLAAAAADELRAWGHPVLPRPAGDAEGSRAAPSYPDDVLQLSGSSGSGGRQGGVAALAP
jgi:hydrogenase maturation protease